MRVLLLFRGSSGCGKSTYIKKHGLEKYALSADNIRLKIQSPVLSADGKEIVTQKNDKEVWKILFNLLEKRMGKGEFTVVDATNSKSSEISKYKQLADEYRYRIYIVDMTNVTIEECKRRNAERLPEYKRVPDNVIDKMYARFETQKVPSGIKVIKPDEFDEILYRPIDLSQYKKIHVIGDLHSCYTALHEYLGDELKEDEYYIFVGDYLDRGIEPVETLKFLLSIYNLPNVILLEGNHETYLSRYSNGIEDYSRNFKETTFPYLNKAVSAGEIKKKDLKQLCRRFNQICYFTYGEKKVLVSHGGVSGMKENLIYVSTEQLIRGVGEYEDYLKCAKAFEENTDENTYQINGHRNVEKCEVHATDRCFNLEGGVEHGGFLRAVTLDENGFETHEIKNNVFIEKESVKVELPKEALTNEDIVKRLRDNKYVKEKVMGNISSFNFTREAFRESVWDDQTTKARGLFIDNRTNEIVARGYNKWFKVNEVENTKIANLKNTLKFPVTVYVKENGFLGLISYNKDTDDLMFSTKSVVDYAAKEDDMVNMFKNMYLSLASEEQKKNLLDYLRVNNKTIACECIHQQKDPHIIEYDSNRIYLLDIITNDFEGKKEPYEVLQTAANSFGMMCKEKAFTFDSWEDLYGWYIEATEENYKYNGRYVEGFVVEDSIWFMFKIKTAYYNMWKMLRGITPSVIKKGYINKTSNLYNAVSNYYYGWLRDHRDEYIKIDENGKKIIDDVNIIDLRKKFEVDMADKNNG